MPFTAITWMKEQERDEVASFIDDAMQRTYRCHAHPLPRRVLVARQAGMLVAAIACSERSDGPLPIERIYKIDPHSFPENVRPTSRAMIQLGRWVAVEPNVAEAMLYEAARYALQRNHRWVISEVKPQVERRFKRLDIPLHHLTATLRRDRISSFVAPYYDPPLPVPCMADLDVVHGALHKIIAKNAIRYNGPGP